MPRLRDRLPPANSLVVFEAVARHLSFTKAAKELRVSQAAVSRQVQLAEDHLGVRLFDRLYREIKLTAQGRALFDAVSMGLGHIAHVAEELRREIDFADITISSSVTFASYWLMSRIAKFRAQFPDIDVRLVASARVRDLATTGLDFAVRYGRGSWPGADTDLMFGNDIIPVCAPSYLKAHGKLRTPADLQGATLLKLSQFDRNWTTWDNWFEAFGLEDLKTIKSLRFDNYLLLIHAAVRGEGVALCGRRLADDLIRNGELVQPIEASLKSEYSFYLLRPVGEVLGPAQTRFRDWLLAEARMMTETPAEPAGVVGWGGGL